jgi:hypothetical protein
VCQIPCTRHDYVQTHALVHDMQGIKLEGEE